MLGLNSTPGLPSFVTERTELDPRRKGKTWPGEINRNPISLLYFYKSRHLQKVRENLSWDHLSDSETWLQGPEKRRLHDLNVKLQESFNAPGGLNEKVRPSSKFSTKYRRKRDSTIRGTKFPTDEIVRPGSYSYCP